MLDDKVLLKGKMPSIQTLVKHCIKFCYDHLYDPRVPIETRLQVASRFASKVIPQTMEHKVEATLSVDQRMTLVRRLELLVGQNKNGNKGFFRKPGEEINGREAFFTDRAEKSIQKRKERVEEAAAKDGFPSDDASPEEYKKFWDARNEINAQVNTKE